MENATLIVALVWQTKTTVNLKHTDCSFYQNKETESVDRFDVDIYFDNTKSYHLNHHFIGTPVDTSCTNGTILTVIQILKVARGQFFFFFSVSY